MRGAVVWLLSGFCWPTVSMVITGPRSVYVLWVMLSFVFINNQSSDAFGWQYFIIATRVPYRRSYSYEPYAMSTCYLLVRYCYIGGGSRINMIMNHTFVLKGNMLKWLLLKRISHGQLSFASYSSCIVYLGIHVLLHSYFPWFSPLLHCVYTSIILVFSL